MSDFLSRICYTVLTGLDSHDRNRLLLLVLHTGLRLLLVVHTGLRLLLVVHTRLRLLLVVHTRLRSMVCSSVNGDVELQSGLKTVEIVTAEKSSLADIVHREIILNIDT